MTPRATDWGLALLVGLLFLTGLVSLFAGRSGDAWIFALHGAGGFALGAFVGWKLRRVWRRVLRPRLWDRGTGRGAAAAAVVLLTLVTGWAWSTGLDVYVAGYNVLSWHFVLGTGLTAVVLAHALIRAKPIRRADLAGRRQFLALGAVAAGAYAAWWAQRPVSALFGLRGARRRFTGSYEAASFQGNAFPTTSWVADKPRSLDQGDYRLEVSGLVRHSLSLSRSELDGRDVLEATLDCTGGFYSRQRWGGARLARVLERAGPLPEASHVRVFSHTGYRWSFSLEKARELLLATEVGGEPLSHEHGAPVRLVAPGRRGFQWVKWVVRLELHDGPDDGAMASTIWSSFTPEGRGS